MATVMIFNDVPGFRSSYLGNGQPQLPTGKTISEVHVELGETVPAQVKAYSTFRNVTMANGKPIYVFSIGQAGANEYLVCVPAHQIKNMTIKTA